jgi:hypothetical protein
MRLSQADTVRVRDRAADVARWLRLLRAGGHPTTTAFSFLPATWRDMVDPGVEVEQLLAACRRMQDAVDRQLIVERIRSDGLWSNKEPPIDPCGLGPRTTERGAILGMIRDLLAEIMAWADGKSDIG